MSAPARNIRVLSVAGAVLVMLFGIWAGARFYPGRAVAPVAGMQAPTMRVPAGEASPPILSDSLPGFDAAAPTSSKIPEHLPKFQLADSAGKPTAIATWEGKSLVLNFWATWCAPCRREIPLLKALHAEWAGHDVQVVGIAIDYRDKVLQFADELKIGYPILVGEQDALDVAAQFGVTSPVFPFTVFTDRRGQVVALFVGELHKPQADLILSVVQNLNRDQVALPEARRSIAAGLHSLATSSTG
jgi:thiol-disulfide isomerase/thioredoxin